jgi:transposase
MVVSVPAVRPNMLHLYHWEWNQVHRLAVQFKARVTYLRYTHAISYERLSSIFGSILGLQISVGAIANLWVKVKSSLDDQISQILQRLRRVKLICSDETSARVNGQNQWEWVFQNQDVCLHVPSPSRGTGVINEVLAEHRPDIWVSDFSRAQKNHPAPQWQVCLAHQLRDCQYAIDALDRIFAKGDEEVIIKGFYHPSATGEYG